MVCFEENRKYILKGNGIADSDNTSMQFGDLADTNSCLVGNTQVILHHGGILRGFPEAVRTVPRLGRSFRLGGQSLNSVLKPFYVNFIPSTKEPRL